MPTLWKFPDCFAKFVTKSSVQLGGPRILSPSCCFEEARGLMMESTMEDKLFTWSTQILIEYMGWIYLPLRLRCHGVDHHWDYNTIPSVIYHDWIWFCFVSQLAFALGGYNVYGNSPWCPTTIFSHFSLFWWRGKWLWCPSSVQTVLLAGWDKGCTFSLHPHKQYSFSVSLVERTF